MSVTAEKSPSPYQPKGMLIDGKWVGSVSGAHFSGRESGQAQPIADVPRAGSGRRRCRGRCSREGAAGVEEDRAARARQAVAQDRRGDPGAQRGARAHHRARNRQCAAHPGARRGHIDRRHLPLFRRPRFGAEGRDRAARRARAVLYPPRAARHRRRHHPVERAGHAGRAQDRARFVRRQRHGAEGGRGCAARRADDGRYLPGIPAARRAERADRLRPGMRAAARQPSEDSASSPSPARPRSAR